MLAENRKIETEISRVRWAAHGEARITWSGLGLKDKPCGYCSTNQIIKHKSFRG